LCLYALIHRLRVGIVITIKFHFLSRNTLPVPRSHSASFGGFRISAGKLRSWKNGESTYRAPICSSWENLPILFRLLGCMLLMLMLVSPPQMAMKIEFKSSTRQPTSRVVVPLIPLLFFTYLLLKLLLTKNRKQKETCILIKVKCIVKGIFGAAAGEKTGFPRTKPEIRSLVAPDPGSPGKTLAKVSSEREPHTQYKSVPPQTNRRDRRIPYL